MSKTLTLLLMDPPFESANTTTALRLIAAALRKGHTVNVFAYEGAVNLTMQGQQPPPLHFGTASIDFPPHLDEDLRKAAQAGVKLVLLRDDTVLRGIPNDALLPEVEQISREQLADFLDGFDLVWHW
jgi:sulfur relay (sulfurtransferase) complex TusBCD TusD component (DsrE family)